MLLSSPHRLSFIFLLVRRFFSLHFLIVEDHGLPKSVSYILSVTLTLECVRILSRSVFFFYFNGLLDDVLCKIAI